MHLTHTYSNERVFIPNTPATPDGSVDEEVQILCGNPGCIGSVPWRPPLNIPYKGAIWTILEVLLQHHLLLLFFFYFLIY